jgi:hypothetical protein
MFYNNRNRAAIRAAFAPRVIAGISNACTNQDLPEMNGRLNLLIPGPGDSVFVRLNWTAVPHDLGQIGDVQPDGSVRWTDENGRLWGVTVPQVSDGTLATRTHSPYVTNWPGLAAAVADLRAEWGDLLCQINATLPD